MGAERSTANKTKGILVAALSVLANRRKPARVPAHNILGC